MSTKLSDITVEELKALITQMVQEAMEDGLEDLLALNNPEYVRSIEEARDDYRRGKVKSLEQFFGA